MKREKLINVDTKTEYVIESRCVSVNLGWSQFKTAFDAPDVAKCNFEFELRYWAETDMEFRLMKYTTTIRREEIVETSI